MKLLLDENLSPKLTSRLISYYPESTHIRDVGLLTAVDEIIWEFAKAQNFIVVTKDWDFKKTR